MKALIWKKYKWITQSIRNIMYFFATPAVILVILFFSTKNNNAVVCYFPFISITLGILFDQMDIENIVQKEYAMYTPMSLKESWIWGAVTSWLFRFIYSVIMLTVGLISYKFFYGTWYASWEYFVQGMINGISALGIVVFSTQYEMDFSTWKQWLSFMWIIPISICIILLDDKMSSFVPIGFGCCLYILVFSILLACFSFYLNKNATTENFIVSLDGIKKIANARFNIVDD